MKFLLSVIFSDRTFNGRDATQDEIALDLMVRSDVTDTFPHCVHIFLLSLDEACARDEQTAQEDLL